MQITNDWFTHNVPHWQTLLADFQGKEGLDFLEIGCYEGMATHWLCKNILTDETSRITVVDTFEGSIEHHDGRANTDFSVVEANFRHNLDEFIQSGKVDIFKDYSQHYLRQIEADRFHFIYVDGSHTAPDVLEDAVLAWRLLKAGGVMIFDDYEWNAYPEQPELNPKLAVDSFLAVMVGKYELLHKQYQVAIKKL